MFMIKTREDIEDYENLKDLEKNYPNKNSKKHWENKIFNMICNKCFSYRLISRKKTGEETTKATKTGNGNFVKIIRKGIENYGRKTEEKMKF